MAKQLDGWADEKPDGKPVQHVGCGNGFFGCGRQCRITKWHPASQTFEAENYNPKVRLCIGCSNAAANLWGIAFEDVDFLMSAMQGARAGKMGAEGNRDEVYALLDRMGVKRPKPIYTQSRALPVGDRA